MRPAWFRPGIADDARSTFLDVRFGRLGAAIDGLLPTTLVRDQDLRRVISGADVVHSLAREWAGALERAARAEGAAFVETPLVHPGQPFSGDTASDLARYRRADAVIALANWEATWYRERGGSHVHVTGVGPNLVDLPEVAREPATILFVGRKEGCKGYYSLRRGGRRRAARAERAAADRRRDPRAPSQSRARALDGCSWARARTARVHVACCGEANGSGLCRGGGQRRLARA